jgi:hypothetical protein
MGVILCIFLRKWSFPIEEEEEEEEEEEASDNRVRLGYSDAQSWSSQQSSHYLS